MKFGEHVAGLQRALQVRRGLDPAIPKLARPGIDNLRRFRANAWALLTSAARQAEVVRVDMLYKPTLVVKHPDDLATIFEQPEVWQRGEGLVPLIGRNTLTTNGEEWLFNRQAIQPSFHPRMMDGAADAFSAVAAEALAGWDRLIHPRNPMDVAHHAVKLFARHATQAFGIEVSEAEAAAMPEALLRLQRWAFRVVAGGARRSPQVRADLALLEGIVTRALQAPAKPGAPPTLVERLRQDHSVDRARLPDHVMLALIAPSDNPPNAFAFTLWLLSRNPDHQEAVRGEVLRALGAGPVTAEAVLALPLLDRVVQEALRVLPPVWWLARIAQADTTLRGHRIPADTMAFIPLYAVHRHPAVWTDPETFDPDRFLPAAVERRHRYAWLPFGTGPRTCIGTRLATLEVRVLLALFLQRFRALPAGPSPLPLHGSFALRSQVGVPVRLERLAAGGR